MASLVDVLRYVWNFTVFFITNCYGLFAYLMCIMTLFPLRFFFPSLYWNLESLLFKGLQSFIILWMGTGGYGVIESGDDISRLSEEEVLVLCNHQSTADTPVVVMSLWGKGRSMNHSMWIMDWIFKFTNFGLICAMRKDVFIKQGKETRELQGEMLKEHLKQNYLPLHRKWIILFPEGGFLHKRLESSQSYARKNGYPVLHNVTLPRFGALKTIINTVGSSKEDESSKNTANTCDTGDLDHPLKWLVDMTIGYCKKSGPPDMFGMCIGYREKQDVYVHYRAYALSEIPRGGEELQKWLFDRYVEKDCLLDHFNKHGRFPAENEGRVLPILPEQQIIFDWLKVALFQLFYLVSAYIYYTCIIKPLICLVF